MNKNVGEDIYGQIVSTWRFLHVGLALDTVIEKVDLSKIIGFSKYSYNFEADAIKAFWPKKLSGALSESYFGSHIFYFSMREIFSGIVEGIDNDKNTDEILLFLDFVKEKLDDQFEAYEAIVKFSRNVLSHNLTSTLTLESKDFEVQKNYLKKNGITQVNLDVVYSKIFGSDYPYQGEFNISFDFDKVVEGKSLLDFINPEKLMQLTIFSGSIAESYINTRTTKFMRSVGITD